MSLRAAFKLKRPIVAWALGFLLGAALPDFAADGTPLKFSGAGWTQFGQIVKSVDTLGGRKLNGRSMIGTGSQFGMEYKASDQLEVKAGLGAVASHLLATQNTNGYYSPMNISPYVSAASVKYSFMDEGDAKLYLQVGLFPYDYAPDAQNLGLYLLRGPVYPGFLLSGFETKYVLPVANLLGFQIHHRSGSFEEDVLLTTETDYAPYYDLSPVFIAAYRPSQAFRIGAGINLYHYIPVDYRLTNNTIDVVKYVDTVTHETTNISFKGIKLMANFSLDPKAMIGQSGIFGQEDLKLYGEIGLIGLDNDKAHKALYGSLSKRMPVMAGFNIPAFGWLDRVALELEYYGAPWADNPYIYEHVSGHQPTPIPIAFSDPNVSTSKDNFKWSLYASKTIQSHIKVSVQAASDHFRPGLFNGYGDNNPPSNETVFLTPSDWYWTTKVAYFF